MEVVDALGSPRNCSRVEEGHIVLGDSPGNGIQFDEDKLAQHAIIEAAAEASPSSWGRRQGAGLVVVGEGEPEEVGEE